MLSIGEIARATGVSRRMLRHWEDLGLIAPATVDEHSGYRWYVRTQVGRVRAIRTLRTLGFSLADVSDLLDHSELTHERLVALLTAREQRLEADISEASARLDEVRQRLDHLRRGHDTIMSTLELGPLPSLRLGCLRARVTDESEIAGAVADLVPRLGDVLRDRGAERADVVLVYDGAPDAADIVVAVGSDILCEELPSGLTVLEVGSAERAVTVRFDAPPEDVGDAWISLDTALEAYALETTGPYRQVVGGRGGVVLQAPVVARTPG